MEGEIGKFVDDLRTGMLHLSNPAAIFVKKAIQVEAQKLELITWIASIKDQRVLEKLYSVRKAQESKTRQKKGTNAEALALLDQITAAYVAAVEPDLNLAQIFTERTKPSDIN